MENNEKKSDEKPNDEEKGHCWKMCVLIFLYVLQGIPVGLAETIPLILQNRKVTYDDQALFSIVFWPYSVKVLWAPIAEAIPSNVFGKRKAFIVPVQILIGIIMIIISMNIDEWLGDPTKGTKPNIPLLTIMFLTCYTLCTVQDVSVDGWAITMLSSKNVGHAATCDCVGGSLGEFFGYVVAIILDSPDFCNKWIRSTPKPTGIVPLAYSIGFWGIMYFVTTAIIAIFQKEKVYVFQNEEEISLSFKKSYAVLWEILKLKPLRKHFVFMTTCGIIFSAIIAVAPLKFIEIGVPREKFAMMDVPLIPIHIGLPFLLSHFIVNDRPMNLLLLIMPYWFVLNILTAIIIYVAPMYKVDNEFPLWYFIALFILYAVQQTMRYCRNVSATAFNAQSSDPRCASTYITLLHTIFNIGNRIPATIAIWLVDKLTWKECTTVCTLDSQCFEKEICTTVFDGFHIEVAACVIFGIGWMIWARKEVNELHELDKSAWFLKSSVYCK